MIWMVVLNYLQMMYEQLKMIKQFSWVLGGFFWSIIFLRATIFLGHGVNEYYKTKIWEMSIIEKTQQTQNMIFNELSKYIFWLYPPIKNLEKSKKGIE